MSDSRARFGASARTRFNRAAVRANLDELLARVGAKVVIGVWVIVFLFPLYYGFAGSTMTRLQLYSYPPRLVPGTAFVENYATTIFETGFLRATANSLIFAVGAEIGLLIICTPAGYAFAKYDFRGQRLLLLLILGFFAVPFPLISIPLFSLLVDWGLVNTYAGVILPAMAAPLGVFFMKQNIEQVIDSELIRSGRVDGASDFQIFLWIVLPLLKPGVLALGIYMFIRRMKEYYWPLIVLREEEMQVFQVWVNGLQSAHGPSAFETILPASVMVTVLLLVVFLLGQQYFIRGLTQGAIKG